MQPNRNKRNWPNGGEGSSSSAKRVRFGHDREGTLEEVDDSDLLEKRKSRRRAVTVVEYKEGEESSDDEVFNKKKQKIFVDDIPEAAMLRPTEGEEEGKEEDMFADPDVIERGRAGKKKMTKGKKRAFDLSEIEGEDLNLNDLDEEEFDSDGNPKIEGFNMKEELEDGGVIDETGNFIRKLDPDRFHDSWLEGVSRKDIQAAHEAHERKVRQALAEEQEAAANA
ncbi:hypothetical protein BGZ65_001597, partial [Modicella reniformis]